MGWLSDIINVAGPVANGVGQGYFMSRMMGGTGRAGPRRMETGTPQPSAPQSVPAMGVPEDHMPQNPIAMSNDPQGMLARRKAALIRILRGGFGGGPMG